jgi:TIR domain/Pentapeptide repeats (8 copies)
MARTSFFVSYTGSDSAWAKWIAWQLEAAGYTTLIQAWDSRPGTNFLAWMNQAAKQAERTLVVLSPAYEQAGGFTVPEWTAAMYQDPDGSEGLVVPVRVAEGVGTGLLGPLGWIDLVGLDEDEANAALLEGVRRERLKPAVAPDFPGGQPAKPSFPGTGDRPAPPRLAAWAGKVPTEVDRLHYEDDPLAFRRHLIAISDARSLTSAMEELLVINRDVWRYLLEEFAETCGDPEEPPRHAALKNQLKKLERNRRATAHLLRQRSFDGLDFSDTFYPDLQAPAVKLSDCNFSSSFLHYSNFHGAEFDRCNFARCILIGSYLEAATFRDCTLDDRVDHTARYHGDDDDDRDLSSVPPSFMWEAEQGWYGYWTEQADQVGTRRVFNAVWPNPYDRTRAVEATIVLGEDGRFERSGSGNDGAYEIIPRDRWFVLDRRRRVALVGGTRILARGVASVWWAIWWQQLGPRPMPPP